MLFSVFYDGIVFDLQPLQKVYNLRSKGIMARFKMIIDWRKAKPFILQLAAVLTYWNWKLSCFNLSSRGIKQLANTLAAIDYTILVLLFMLEIFNKW